MTLTPPPRPSVWRLRWDVLWARFLLVLTQAERRGELEPDVHRFLAGRYAGLAEDSGARGLVARLERYRARAREHAERAGGDDDLPPACAMGLPRQRRRTAVEARGPVLPGRWPEPRSR
jgi:hypothetical protein